MLNPFPSLLVYSMLAPFLLRLVLGFIFINLGLLAWKTERSSWITSFKALRIPRPEAAVKLLGVIEALAGLSLLVGLYTQIAALVLSILTLAEAYLEYKDPAILKRNLVFYMILLAVSLSLLFSGAGAYAFDLPL